MKKPKDMILGAVFISILGLVGMGLVWCAVVSVGEMRRRVKTELRVEGLIQAANQFNDYLYHLNKKITELQKLTELYGIQTLTK